MVFIFLTSFFLNILNLVAYMYIKTSQYTPTSSIFKY